MSAIKTQGALCGYLWPVEVTPRQDGGYDLFGKSTQLTVYAKRLDDGNILVSVPDIRRCGCVPLDPRGIDVEKYCDVENRVDAATIAAAIKAIGKERGNV